MAQTIAQLYAWLIEQIAEHDRAYYLEDSPLIADAQYDALYKELLDIERQHPHLITADSPSKKVGGYSNEVFSPVKHGSPMLSLNNALTEE